MISVFDKINCLTIKKEKRIDFQRFIVDNEDFYIRLLSLYEILPKTSFD